MESENWKERVMHLRHDLAEALNYFMVAKMNFGSPNPNREAIETMLVQGEHQLRSVLETLSALVESDGG